MLITGTVREADGGQGIPGVGVCNGESFVRTGDDGCYELDVEPGGHAFVWVCLPDGFCTGARFYHGLLDPLPTDRRSYDFELRRRHFGGGFRLAHITDLHLDIEGTAHVELASAASLQQALDELLKRSEPDLIVVGGDLTNHGTLDEMEEVHRVLSSVDKPLFPMFGNHDGSKERRIQLAREGKADATFTRHYERFFGPPYYSFDWGGYHFLLYVDFDRCLSPADQTRKAVWLESDLQRQSPDRPIVVALHGPPPADLLSLLNQYNVKTVLYGHRHSSKVFQQNHMEVVCTPAFCFGGTDTSPASYCLLDFNYATGADSKPQHRFVTLGEDRLNPETDLGHTLPTAGLKLAWERRIAGDVHRSAPLYHGGGLLVSLAGENFDSGSGVLCLDAADGRELWRFQCEGAVKNTVAAAETGVCAAATVHGEVHLLETETGNLRWSSKLPGYPDFFLYTSPLVSPSAVFVVEKGFCGALDQENGELKWFRSMDPNDQTQTPFRRGVSGRDVPSFTGFCLFRHLLVGLIPGRGLVGLHQDSGEIEWETEMEGGKQAFAMPVLAGEHLVSGGGPDELVVVEADSGAVLWRRKMLEGGLPTGLAVGDSRLFASSVVGGLRCVDLATGDLIWTFETGEDLLDMIPRRRGLRSILAAPVLWDGLVVLGGNDGVLYLIDTMDGECRGSLRFGVPITATPCLTDLGFCVRTWDGRLFSLYSQ